MRKSLLYRPDLFFERIGQILIERKRIRRLRNTPAANLQTGHIDSMELLELVKPAKPRVFYDIGANVGTWSILAKALYPNAIIEAFEPLQKHIEQFSKNTHQLEGIRIHGLALGSASGRAEVRIADFSDASSLLEFSPAGRNLWHLEQVGSEETRIERLDDYVRSEKLLLPDLLKMDVQGFELQVLQGAELCLRNARAVLTEVSFREFYKEQCLFHELASFLASRGFGVLAFGHGTMIARPLLQADVLFIKADPANPISYDSYPHT